MATNNLESYHMTDAVDVRNEIAQYFYDQVERTDPVIKVESIEENRIQLTYRSGAIFFVDVEEI